MSPAEQLHAEIAHTVKANHSGYLAAHPEVFTVRSCVTGRGFEEVNVMTTRRKPDPQHWEPTA